jgi:apolipoprotein N-acyltransferase
MMLRNAIFFFVLLVSSLLTSVSWLEEKWSISIWFGMILFLWIIPRDSQWRSALYSSFFGAVSTGVSFYWATKTLAYTLNTEEGSYIPHAVFGALLVWESIPYALMGWMISLQHIRYGALWMAPVVWVVLESAWPRVFPWSLAHSQTKFLSFLQSAELGGAQLVSFLFLYACFGVSSLLRSDSRLSVKKESYLALGLACFSIFAGWGRLTWLESVSHTESLRIGVVQIDPSYVDSPEKMRQATDAMSHPIDLVVWPESTLGTYSTEVGSLDAMIQDVSIAKPPFINTECAKNMPNWLLVGGRTFRPGNADEGPYWQTAFLIDNHGAIQGTYQKRHLIPIGEFVPFEKNFPVLHDLAQLSEYIEPGHSDEPLAVAGGPSVGVLICYEDLIESAARRTVDLGAQVLVGLINASAFETVEALEQHRRLALLRTIENRRCFVRCAGTGVSCYISHTGREVQRIETLDQGHFVANVPLLRSSTVYRMFGCWMPWFMFLALAIRLCVKPRGKLGSHSDTTGLS